MDALLETRRHPTALSRLIETGIATKSFEAQLVPVSIFWGRDPGKETSLWKLLFADSVQAGRVQKFFIMLFNGRNVLANRSEERRVGKARVSTGRSRWSPIH